MTHILLQNIVTYKRRKKIVAPLNYSYDQENGHWISTTKKLLLVHDPNFPSIASKKRDVETGEDEKGQ